MSTHPSNKFFLSHCLSLLLFSSAALSAAGIHVGWSTGGFKLARPPAFPTKKLNEKGTVYLRLNLRPEGTVSSVTPITGEPALTSIAVESAKSWQFVKAPGLPARLLAIVYFSDDNGTKAGGLPTPPPPPWGAVVDAVSIEDVSSETQARLRNAIHFNAGEAISEVAFKGIKRQVASIDPTLGPTLTIRPDSRLILRIGPRGK